jgi:LuxR family maltose regulon positive regulatory protein
MAVIAHPDIGRRTPSLVHARATLALVAVGQGRLASARSHAEQAKAAVGRIGTSRSWLGANASVALGAVLAAEGNLVDSERELATAEHFFRDEMATLHRTWLMVLVARVRLRRGRLDEAEASLGAAVEALDELTDSGVVAVLADEVERELSRARGRARGGDVLEPPSEAEFAVLRLLTTDLSTREIGDRLFLSANTIRSHT